MELKRATYPIKLSLDLLRITRGKKTIKSKEATQKQLLKLEVGSYMLVTNNVTLVNSTTQN